ncbi:MAG: hypothetical protein ABIL68_06680 [bacterium]
MAPKSKPVVQSAEGKTEVKLIPDPNFVFSYPRYYSNHISIHSTPLDFTFRFCEALPIYEKPKKVQSGEIELKIPIKAEIVIPKEVFPALITAMQVHYEKFTKAYGEATADEKKA